GALVTINHAELVEVFGHLGYDFVFLDAQHGGLSVETARELIRAAELTGMTPLVRVPRNDPAVILNTSTAALAGSSSPTPRAGPTRKRPYARSSTRPTAPVAPASRPAPPSTASRALPRTTSGAPTRRRWSSRSSRAGMCCPSSTTWRGCRA